MSKIYLLFYDTDNGDREEWNTFYTPWEAFTTKEARAERKKVLEKRYANLGVTFEEQENELDLAPDSEGYRDEEAKEADYDVADWAAAGTEVIEMWRKRMYGM